MTVDLEIVRDYHARTKHHFDRYAAGPDYLDWDQQPDPFRRFSNTTLIDLPLSFGHFPDAFLGDVDKLQPYKKLKSWGLPEISSLLRFSLGLSAWKVFGPDRWALRCNPSSGNLHATECYLAIRGLSALQDGIYHYAPHEHGLELRAVFSKRDEVISNPDTEILVGLSSIAWREAWKYGERAYRYVQLDLGHAVGALAYSIATLGLILEPVNIDSDSLATMLGIDRDADFKDAECEYPDLLLRIKSKQDQTPLPVSETWLEQAHTADWHGQANILSKDPHHHWQIIQSVGNATRRSSDGNKAKPVGADLPPPLPTPKKLTRKLILQRRSAQAFSGKSSMSRETLYQMLDALLSRPERTPWSSWLQQPRIHLILFVHHIDGLDPGLYLLPRRPEIQATLKASMADEFLWEIAAGSPDHLPLYHLLSADAKQAAQTLSCHQDIAASSYFSLGMLAEFDSTLETDGPQAYPELFWEAGLIGHVLYLQAEAAGVRGTGIGCFFDDAVHETLGLSNNLFQSLYHFTVGSAKTDDRLQTLPPYQHLHRS
ncbi:MAG: nitroreductase family protein [Candidatus Thiodiazotropha sp. (ex Lucinoma borealis)]|nr:nitroreductase family protein [Candidatus Thiodiazotropha sp. (ex Lucinoma borealis)]MCU7839960.1 nitroreductase family protein [Candidatus Thiodiazotropha sp. (ex Troendleina suluensis)]MCU7862357.1 nitroreductase family protein [Candidatus Thiodiazotropha sp. (ex Lucinoma borealis)]MCU7946026.1 nitroreductase family protein [Candidatus Thiodiazotropha sp. (ex Cardiolucina cf. quadrata)]